MGALSVASIGVGITVARLENEMMMGSSGLENSDMEEYLDRSEENIS